MPNIRILALAVLQIFCSQGCSCIVEKRGVTPERQDWWRKKNTGPLIFHVHATYIISRFQHKRFLSLSAANELRTDGQTDGRADRRTDGRTDRPKPICPFNFSEVGGIITQLKIYRISSKVNKFIYTLASIYVRNIKTRANAFV